MHICHRCSYLETDNTNECSDCGEIIDPWIESEIPNLRLLYNHDLTYIKRNTNDVLLLLQEGYKKKRHHLLEY